MRTLTLSGLFVWLVSLLACSGTATPRGTAPAPKADAATQGKRTKLLEKFTAAGVVAKLEPGELPKLWVTPAYMRLPIAEKKVIAELAFAYAWELPIPVKLDNIDWSWGLSLKHSVTGKQVGVFSPRTGLDME